MGDMSEAQQVISKDDRKMMRTPSGHMLPAGRPKGTPNKVTRSIREAVEKASHECHPRGLAGWLLERSRGGIQDRQIFAAMVMKALPLQVQAQVDGGIRIELGWLGGRSVGATAAQIADDKSQVIDLQRDSDGVLRIKDPMAQADADTPAAPVAPEAAGGAER